MNGEPHKLALKLEDEEMFKAKPGPLPAYAATPLGKAFFKLNENEKVRVKKLIEIAYVVAKEEMPFTKFVAIAKLEKRHGVELGQTYLNDHACADFVDTIAEIYEEELNQMLKRVHYYSILVDGSTDARSKEKEVIYILYVDPDTGRQRLRFLSLQKVEHATATDVLALIKKAFEHHGVDSLKEHTVGFGADGAAVNLGVRGGVSVLMKDGEGIDWLVTVHCASHRLELSIADALKSTVFSDINEMLQNVYSFYKRSPKKMVQLEGLGEALEMAVSMPVKASGTRWLEHKIRAMNWISKNYGLLIAPLNHLTEDESFTSADRQKFKGMYTKYRNAKYPLFVEYFIEILVPAAELGLIFRREKIDVVEAVRAVKKFFRIMNKLSESSEVVFTTGRVSNFFSNLTNQEEQFIYKDVNLSHIEQAKNSLKSANDDILSTIIECFKGRFDDITNTDNLFNALVKILDTEVYPEQGLDDVYGEDEVKLVID
ncbi:zinc finger 862-like, partial [Paramuricea clavata]